MNRTKIVIGNWKMNLTVPESTLLLERLIKTIKVDKTIVAVCPSYLSIYPASDIVKNSDIEICAQNTFWEDAGAYTGEISAHQLKGFAKYCIVGHSERRKYFLETDKIVAKKAASLVRHNITPVICVGESLHEKMDGLTKLVVTGQLEASLSDLTKDEIAKSIIAYEPVWAIGTGHVCEPKKANEAIKQIRDLIKALYGEKTANSTHIIYGGSVDDKNVESFIKETDIDGVLVGTVSPDFKVFTKIVNIVEGKDEISEVLILNSKSKKIDSNKKTKKKK